MKLWLCYLGGKIAPNRIGEDHECVLVVAASKEEARRRAKEKWKGEYGGVHIDATVEVTSVDGYLIQLTKTDRPDELAVDVSYVE